MATQGITYAGIHLLMDLDGEVGSFLEKWLPVNGAVRCPPKPHVDDRSDMQAYDYPSVKMPTLNYPPPPDLQISQLYWPTGAARWSVGQFLASESAVRALRNYVYLPNRGSHLARSLRVSYSGTTVVDTKMHMLEARPLSGVLGDRLFLITLVDERYFWQSIGLGAVPSGRPPSGPPDPIVLSRAGTWTTWDELIASVFSQLGVTTYTVDAYDSAYLSPDPTEFTRYFDSASQVLDGIALSLGMRVIRNFDGTVRLMNRVNSTTRRIFSLRQPFILIAGDTWPAPPATERLLVAFPRVIQGHHDCSGWYHWVDVANSQISGDYQAIDETCDTWAEATSPADASGVSGLSETIYTSCHAEFDENDDDCPANNAAVQALAKRIATDFYAYQSVTQLDITFAGVQPWALNGYDDYILLDFGTECPPRYEVHSPPPDDDGPVPPEMKVVRERRFTTRVRSMPQDFGSRHQLSEDSTVVLVQEPWFQLVEHEGSSDHMDPGSSATFQYVTLAANGTFTAHTPALYVTINDPAHLAFVIVDEVIKGEWSCSRQQWEPADEYGLHRRGKVDETQGISDGSTGTVEIWQDDQATGVTVEVEHDWLAGGLTVTDEKEVYIIYDRVDEEWWDPGAECE
jgi:hypothetical protein